ncbi:MAG: DUF1273 family protein [Clostridia bacterium]|nr:DUF1273 family protein [Clostridia bacterium]
MSEKEKRLRRCCFAGHRPEDLPLTKEETVQYLDKQITSAIQAGYVTFLTGMSMGVDLWAAEIVLEKRKTNPSLHLIAVVPYPAFSLSWQDTWKESYQKVLNGADLSVTLCPKYQPDALDIRNEWMASHAACLICIYNGSKGHTGKLVDLCRAQGLDVHLYPFLGLLRFDSPRPYPLNFLDAIMTDPMLMRSKDVQLPDLPNDIDARLTSAMAFLKDGLAEPVLNAVYRQRQSIEEIAGKLGMQAEEIQRIHDKALQKLRQPDILRFLNCKIQNIPETSSKTMVKKLQELS